METVKELCGYVLDEHVSIRECVETINNNKDNIALILDSKQELIGTVTDGDVRRYLLKGGALDDSCRNVVWENPVTANLNDTEKDIRALMSRNRITSVPIVDENNVPRQIARIHDLVSSSEGKTTAVIMAGGEGRRLRPITEHVPKPMVEVGGSPILKRIVCSLRDSGIREIYIAVNYLADVIEEYFSDGEKLGVCIRYLKEEQKLGTCGALSMLPSDLTGQLLVINGDVVTDVNLQRILNFHQQQHVVMTVAAVDLKIKVPYGVLQHTGQYVSGLEEKPEKQFFCSAGIYVLNANLLSQLSVGVRRDMPELMKMLIDRGLPVTMFPIHEHWLDIGEKEALEKARRAAAPTLPEN